MGFLKLLVMWLLAVLMMGGAVVYGWVALKTQARSGVIERRRRLNQDEDVIRRACDDLDDKYRELLKH